MVLVSFLFFVFFYRHLGVQRSFRRGLDMDGMDRAGISVSSFFVWFHLPHQTGRCYVGLFYFLVFACILYLFLFFFLRHFTHTVAVVGRS